MTKIQVLEEQLRIATRALNWYDNNGIIGHKKLDLTYEHLLYLSGQLAHDALRDIDDVATRENESRGISLKEYLHEKNT